MSGSLNGSWTPDPWVPDSGQQPDAAALLAYWETANQNSSSQQQLLASGAEYLWRLARDLADALQRTVADTWIVLIEDRHASVEAKPFSTEDAAMSFARQQAVECASRLGDVRWDTPLNDAMVRDGWALYLPYGPEGDNVRVVRRQLDQVPEKAP